MSEKYKVEPVSGLDAVVTSSTQQIGGVMCVGDAEDVANELNTLAAENARLREALGRVAKCDVGVCFTFKEESDRLRSIAKQALNS